MRTRRRERELKGEREGQTERSFWHSLSGPVSLVSAKFETRMSIAGQ